MAAATKPEVGRHLSPAEEIDENRRAVTERHALDVATTRGRDLSELTNREFEDGVERVKLVQTRMQRILKEVLVKDAHYGNPKNAFKAPILFKGGAEEIRRLMRLSVRRMEADEIVATPDLCSAIVTLGIYDASGRLLATRRGACTTLEKRFKKFDGSDWIYQDPREKLHDVIAMAEKRAAGLLTCEVSGATAFLSNGDTMEDALEEDKPVSPWTAEEKKIVYAAAAKRKMTRNDMAALTLESLGRAAVGTGDDVEMLLAAIKEWKPKGKEDAKAEAPGGASPAPAPEPASTPAEAGEDPELAFDRTIAEKDEGAVSTETLTADHPGIRQVAERARHAFGDDAVPVLRKWAQQADDHRYNLAADLIEKEQAEEQDEPFMR